MVSWAPSPDEELDDRLYYVVTQHDSNTRLWKIVADRLFTHTYMANNILPGTEYHFRIYAKNDMGLSDPSHSPVWGVNNNRGISIKSSLLKLKSISLWLVLIWRELEFKLFPLFSFPYFSSQVPIASNRIYSSKVCFERPPSILVPLKVHTPPKGYQLYMTCAVRGCPTPTVSWYLNDVCINLDKNYFITNLCGVCSMYILRVQPTDSGEYKVVALNSLGKAECSTKIIVQGMYIWMDLP